MNSKLYVVVTVPMLEKSFDLYIPTTKKVGTIKNLIAQIIEEESDHIFIDTHSSSLYDQETGEKISEEEYVKESKIRNGSKLILY